MEGCGGLMGVPSRSTVGDSVATRPRAPHRCVSRYIRSQRTGALRAQILFSSRPQKTPPSQNSAATGLNLKHSATGLVPRVAAPARARTRRLVNSSPIKCTAAIPVPALLLIVPVRDASVPHRAPWIRSTTRTATAVKRLLRVAPSSWTWKVTL